MIAGIAIGSKFFMEESYTSQLVIQSVLGFTFLLVWTILTLKKYHSEKRLDRELREVWLSASEFTLMLSNYPSALIDTRDS
jgi:hypothetical protein